MPVARCVSPRILVRWSPSNILPKSAVAVKVTSISGPFPAMLMRPTDDSGFACVLAEKMRLTASHWASHLEGLLSVASQYARLVLDLDQAKETYT